MSIPSSAIIDFAKRIQQIDDIEGREAIYESVRIDTDGFKKYPADCFDAIKTIKTVGMQVKLLLDARKNLTLKKEDVSKEDEIESKKKEIISEGKREKKGSSPDKLDLSEEKRLEQAEAEALEHALRLSTNTLPISSSDAPKGMEEGDFSSRSSSSSIPDSLFDDELFAYSLQFEENELGHVSSRSSQIAPSFEEAPLSEEEQMRIATEESLAYSSDEEKIEDFTRYHEDNCWINGESLNKYAAIITILSTPTAQDETLPLINDLNDLLDSFGIKFTAELFGDILDLRDQKDITRKFETFKKLIEKGPESERDRHRRFQEYVDDYFRRIRLYKRYNFFK